MRYAEYAINILIINQMVKLFFDGGKSEKYQIKKEN